MGGNCVNNSRAFIEGCVAGLSASLRTYTFRDSQLANRSPRRRYLTLRLLLLLLPRRLLLERHSLQRGVPLFCYAPSPLGAVVPAVAAVGLCCCCCCCCCCCRLLTRPWRGDLRCCFRCCPFAAAAGILSSPCDGWDRHNCALCCCCLCCRCCCCRCFWLEPRDDIGECTLCTLCCC